MQPHPAEPTAVEREQLVEFRRRLHHRLHELNAEIETARALVAHGFGDELVEIRDAMYRRERERDSALDTLERLDVIYPTCRELVA